MLCKYYLQLGTSTVDTDSPDCMEVSRMIKNLDSIKVSYSRVDLGGVVRKCGSSLEFTDKAYDAIIAHYMENYLQSTGVFAVYMADNNWVYRKVWECPLDFATLKYDANVVTIGCVDNSAAAIIKANKSSKYEFDVSDLKDSSPLSYDGVLTKRTFTFNVVGATPTGETTTDMVSTGDIRIESNGSFTLYIPGIGVSIDSNASGKVIKRDQQEGFFQFDLSNYSTDDGRLVGLAIAQGNAGFIMCVEDCSVHVRMSMAFRFVYNMTEHFQHCTYKFLLVAGQSVIWSKTATNGVNNIDIDVDCPLHANEGIAFVLRAMCFDPQYIYSFSQHSFNLFPVGLRWGSNSNKAEVIESRYCTNPVNIDVVKPMVLLRKLTAEMFGADYYVECRIEEDCTIVQRTLLVASESIRRIKDNKIHSSFTDFCKFMEVVFGYVYTVEDFGYLMCMELEEIDKGKRETLSHINSSYLKNSPIDSSGTGYSKMLPIDEIITEDLGSSLDLTTYYEFRSSQGFIFGRVCYNTHANTFVVQDYSTGKYFANFHSIDIVAQGDWYNDETGHAREMIGVNIGSLSETVYMQGTTYVFGVIKNGKLVVCDTPHAALWLDLDENKKKVVKLTFRHRSAVFRSEVIKRLNVVNNMSYQFDESKVYSDVEVGYSKKDYDNNNSAKSEFNFTNYYKSDNGITEDTLSLICPYRADSFGMEEALLKNSDEESDKTDNEIFIVVASANAPANGHWHIDRSIAVVADYKSNAFNAAIAPNKIVKNNEEYIGCFATLLRFTSSDGNSSAIIGGTSMHANISITKQLFKAGKIAIDTDDHHFPEDWDGLVEFEYAGKTYTGYLDSIDINFANLGTITYNLIEKCID